MAGTGAAGCGNCYFGEGVPATEGVGALTEIYPVGKGTRCEITVPQGVESLELQLGAMSQTVELPPGDAQIAVEGQDAKQVAAAYLKEKGFVKG